mmetsp:Transcript_2507/g.8832  ORF Transcript_2507/g.8832 Transcript_2507/m.8832 type:complete len:171 (+) Transcript_2507:2365-2877(+)
MVAIGAFCARNALKPKSEKAAPYESTHSLLHDHGACDADDGRARSRTIALGVGVAHGLAHVVWVLPVLQMPSAAQAATYLGAFCVTSTLMMGTFSSLYGALTKRAGSSEAVTKRVAILSSLLSILIGVAWLWLLFTGSLEDSVFGHAHHDGGLPDDARHHHEVAHAHARR